MMPLSFTATNLFSLLEAATESELDDCEFGVIGMDHEGRVEIYNRTESERAGLSQKRVVGRVFFKTVGICTNNALISGRMIAAAELDAFLDYVFTLRMKITPVKLRLLKASSSRRMYLLVQR